MITLMGSRPHNAVDTALSPCVLNDALNLMLTQHRALQESLAQLHPKLTLEQRTECERLCREAGIFGYAQIDKLPARTLEDASRHGPAAFAVLVRARYPWIDDQN